MATYIMYTCRMASYVTFTYSMGAAARTPTARTARVYRPNTYST